MSFFPKASAHLRIICLIGAHVYCIYALLPFTAAFTTVFLESYALQLIVFLDYLSGPGGSRSTRISSRYNLSQSFAVCICDGMVSKPHTIDADMISYDGFSPLAIHRAGISASELVYESAAASCWDRGCRALHGCRDPRL